MTKVRIKICGITRREDALAAVSFGAWALGFVFYRKSPRFITPAKAAQIIRSLPPFVTPVGVFVNESREKVRRIAEICSLRTLQFHGDESPAYCRRFVKDFRIIKAFRISGREDLKRIRGYDLSAVLLDSYHPSLYGGTGQTFVWPKAGVLKPLKKPVILSGGLNPGNVKRALKTVKPFAVDVSSSVEQAPGIKDYLKVKRFINAVCKPF